ncbi:hypothetical protein OC846_000356 [Tilletia horrida]|uniref:Cytochrome b561 domain-containing protein n=1 Tax=Tilletia horrida TaxID=155126 RepID=A0AAN6GUZ5_9BASI|nr:hypothetical protein OC846_000356 [Tilletia horrida]
MKFSTIGGLALAALSANVAHAAKFADKTCTGPLCIYAVYDDQALQVEYTAAYKGTVGWFGVGQGARMAGANIMVGWPTSSGSVVMSQRYTTSHADPSPSAVKAQAAIPNTSASTTNSSMTVLSWTFPVASGFASSKTAHIWAYSGTSPSSSDSSANIREHDKKGTTYLDLTKALSTTPTSTGANPKASNSGSSTPTNSDGSGDASGDSADEEGSGSAVANRDLSDRTTQMYLAHMIFMTVAWFGLIAAGILVGRFGRVYFPSSWFHIHRIMQGSALVLIIIGFALGYSAVESEGGPHFQDTHNKIGLIMFILVIIQAFWGQIGHMIFRAKNVRLQNYGHILLGVVLFFGLALWQARTGFEAWEWMAPDWIPNILYPVWFGIITLLFLAGLALLPRERRNAAARANRVSDLQRIGSDQDKYGQEKYHV